jgi:negative regulator of replication initiation
MKTIRVSGEVWAAISKVGKFGETPDDVLRRVFRIVGESRGAKIPKRRLATQRMSARVNGEGLVVSFVGGASKNWSLPKRDDKTGIRRVRDAAVLFAEENGATVGQVFAVKKALTEAGYHLVK